MKREIKFRCWDKKNSRWIKIAGYHIQDGEILPYEWVGGGKRFYTEDVDMNQYTGLKDKNGQEIYEGDVVEYHDHQTGDDDNGVGEVYYKDGKWRVTWSMIPLGDFGSEWTEVIGNKVETTK